MREPEHRTLAQPLPADSGSGLLEGLSTAEQDRLRPYFTSVTLRPKELLLEQGQPIDYCWFPMGAVTSTMALLPDGGSIEVGNMGAEGMVGLSLVLGIRLSNATVTCQIGGKALRISADDFLIHVVQHGGELYRRLQMYLNNFMSLIGQVSACNSSHDVESRLARWILMTQDRARTNVLRLTHEFLSQMLGVQRSSVSIALSALANDGLLRGSYGSIEVTNREQLEKRSCACYGVIRKILSNTGW